MSDYVRRVQNSCRIRKVHSSFGIPGPAPGRDPSQRNRIWRLPQQKHCVADFTYLAVEGVCLAGFYQQQLFLRRAAAYLFAISLTD